MMTLLDPQGRLMGCRLRLMELHYEMVYLPGQLHQVPDALEILQHPERSGDNVELDEELPMFGKQEQVPANSNGAPVKLAPLEKVTINKALSTWLHHMLAIRRSTRARTFTSTMTCARPLSRPTRVKKGSSAIHLGS